MSVSLNRYFAGSSFDLAKVRTAFESLTHEVVIQPCTVEAIASTTRPSGARKTTHGVLIDCLNHIASGTEQSIEVEWRANDNLKLEIFLQFFRMLTCSITADEESTLENAMRVLIRDLDLSGTSSDFDVRSHHVGDALAEALKSTDPVLWSRWIQAGRDIADSSRLSYHGPIHDMRDVLASILRSLAPEGEVSKQPWFVQDTNTQGVTQVQRARYILSVVRQRNSESVKTASGAIDAITSIARASYARGSVAHVKATRDEAFQIRRYTSALLSDFLGVEGR